MKKLFFAIILVCQMSSVFPGSSLSQTLDSLLHQEASRCWVGIQIQDMESGDIVYQKNPYQLMKPASLQKIPTSLIVLLELGATYQFETSLREKEGSAYLSFSGDPTLTLNNLTTLFKTYKQKKGSIIQGNIFVNDEKLPVFPYKDGWTVEAVRFKYGAPISIININKNVICFRLIPAINPKQRPIIIYDKGQPTYKIDNQAISAACLEEDYIERCDLNLEDELSIKGCVPQGGSAFKICLPVKEHRFKEYVRKCIQASLKEAGIKLKGKILFRSPPSMGSLKLIAHHSSEPLFQILKEGMKNSNNTVMESLLIPIMSRSREKFRKSNYLDEFVKQTLQNVLKIDVSQLSVMDGCGLSHHNLISAYQIAVLLLKGVSDKRVHEPFMSSLSIGGQDGTLEDRLKDLPKDIKVFAKTGTLQGVSNIAGYILKNGKPKYLFVMMMQNFSEDGKIYEALQDKIITYLSHLKS